MEKRLLEVEAVLFGVRGSTGLGGELAGLRKEFQLWREQETKRREREAIEQNKLLRESLKHKSAATRAIVVALGSALIAMLGVVVQLIGQLH